MTSKKLKWIILNIFNKVQHNKQYLRTIYKYLPGKTLENFYHYYILKSGHLYVVKYFHKQKNHSYNSSDADQVAGYGYLHIIQYFLQEGIKCSNFGLYNAVKGGHLHIIKYLRDNNGISFNKKLGNKHKNPVNVLKANKIIQPILQDADIMTYLEQYDVIYEDSGFIIYCQSTYYTQQIIYTPYFTSPYFTY